MYKVKIESQLQYIVDQVGADGFLLALWRLNTEISVSSKKRNTFLRDKIKKTTKLNIWFHSGRLYSHSVKQFIATDFHMTFFFSKNMTNETTRKLLRQFIGYPIHDLIEQSRAVWLAHCITWSVTKLSTRLSVICSYEYSWRRGWEQNNFF